MNKTGIEYKCLARTSFFLFQSVYTPLQVNLQKIEWQSSKEKYIRMKCNDKIFVKFWECIKGGGGYTWKYDSLYMKTVPHFF